MRIRPASRAALLLMLFVVACSDPDETQPPPVDLGTPLLGKGTVTDTCAPNDGPALFFLIGTDATCTTPAGSDPQLDFITYPGSTSTLAEGQTWSFDPTNLGMQGRAWWYPEGLSAKPIYPKSGFVEVMSFSPIDVNVRYSFQLEDGSKYGGEASLWTCPKAPGCG